MSEQQKLTLALVASAMLHLLLAVCLIMASWLWPDKKLANLLDVPVPPKPLQITVVRRAQPTPAPVVAATPAQQAAIPTPTPRPIKRTVLSSQGLTTAEKKPDKPLFESDIDSRVGSEKPGVGDSPLPSQDGRELPFENFVTRQYTDGRGKTPAQAATPEPSPYGITQLTPPEPSFNPTPVQVRPTPAPAKGKTARPIASAKVTPVPKPITTPIKNTAKPPSTPATSSFVPQTEKTRIIGGALPPGRAGVDAESTPAGRYRKTVYDAVGSLWHYYVDRRSDLMTVGETHIEFYVTASGAIEDARIISNTANETFASYCMQSVTEARVPPLPPDLAGALPGGRMRIDFTFNLYSRQ